MKKRNCSIPTAKTKVLISFAVTAKLICVFVFAYAKKRFSHDEAHMIGRFEILKFDSRRSSYVTNKFIRFVA